MTDELTLEDFQRAAVALESSVLVRQDARAARAIVAEDFLHQYLKYPLTDEQRGIVSAAAWWLLEGVPIHPEQKKDLDRFLDDLRVRYDA